MPKKYRVGIIGFGHMHVNNVAQRFGAHPQVEWVACADTEPIVPELRDAPYTRKWNQAMLMEKLGIPKKYDCYHEMLEKEKFDIIIVQCENSQHPDVVEAAARAGANCCVEKPMAADLSGALRMVRACKANGTELIVNWPLTWSPAARKCKELIDAGTIGRVLEVKWRSGHTGPLGPGAQHAGVSEAAAPMSGPERGASWWHQDAVGGGALLDYCCYGAMVTRWYIGEQATDAVAMAANLDSHWGDAPDNAAVIVRYPSAMAILEGSWTTWHHGVPTGPIVYGQTGTMVVEGDTVRLERGHGDQTIFQAEPIDPKRDTEAKELIWHMDTGDPVHPTLEMMANLEYMAILDAGRRASKSGKMESVDNITWRIG